MAKITSAALMGGTTGTTIENRVPHWISPKVQITYDDGAFETVDLESEAGIQRIAHLCKSGGLSPDDVTKTSVLVGLGVAR